MSYAYDCKEELTHVKISFNQESLTILEAIVHNGFEITLSGFNKIKLKYETRSNPIIRFVIKLLLTNFPNIKYELYQKQIMRFDKPTLFVIEINEDSDILVGSFNLLDDKTNDRSIILTNLELKKAYLRGVFITNGSVNDPKTSNYHLEIQTTINKEAIFIQTLINSFDLNARIAKRKDKYVIYLKDKESICDILRIIGVSVQAFKMEDTIIKRKIMADSKRIVNFDIANQSKTNDANRNILRYIKYLEDYMPLDKIDSKIKIVMEARKNNMEASLQELCEIIEQDYGEKITKSGLNHRFRKIKEMALELKKRNSS